MKVHQHHSVDTLMTCAFFTTSQICTWLIACWKHEACLHDQYSVHYCKFIIMLLVSLNEPSIPAIEPITINTAGVADLLSNIQPFKASGPGNVPAFLLKEIAFWIAPPLAVVFQASLNQCNLPAEWKVAHVFPVIKKGDKSSANNYRPISLTCLCCKFLNTLY